MERTFSLPYTSLSLLSRSLCSGLGVFEILSNEDMLSSRLRDGAFSLSDCTEPDALVTGGDLGRGSRGAVPFDPFGEATPEGGPSDDLMFRVACGSALGGGFLDDLKRNDMVGCAPCQRPQQRATNGDRL